MAGVCSAATARSRHDGPAGFSALLSRQALPLTATNSVLQGSHARKLAAFECTASAPAARWCRACLCLSSCCPGNSSGWGGACGQRHRSCSFRACHWRCGYNRRDQGVQPRLSIGTRRGPCTRARAGAACAQALAARLPPPAQRRTRARRPASCRCSRLSSTSHHGNYGLCTSPHFICHTYSPCSLSAHSSRTACPGRRVRRVCPALSTAASSSPAAQPCFPLSHNLIFSLRRGCPYFL